MFPIFLLSYKHRTTKSRLTQDTNSGLSPVSFAIRTLPTPPAHSASSFKPIEMSGSQDDQFHKLLDELAIHLANATHEKRQLQNQVEDLQSQVTKLLAITNTSAPRTQDGTDESSNQSKPTHESSQVSSCRLFRTLTPRKHVRSQCVGPEGTPIPRRRSPQACCSRLCSLNGVRQNGTGKAKRHQSGA